MDFHGVGVMKANDVSSAKRISKPAVKEVAAPPKAKKVAKVN